MILTTSLPHIQPQLPKLSVCCHFEECGPTQFVATQMFYAGGEC